MYDVSILSAFYNRDNRKFYLRNAIVVFVCMILAMLIHPESCNDDPRQSQCFFTLTGIGQSGLPSLEVPPFSVFRNVTENTTYNYEEINVDIHE